MAHPYRTASLRPGLVLLLAAVGFACLALYCAALGAPARYVWELVGLSGFSLILPVVVPWAIRPLVMRRIYRVATVLRFEPFDPDAADTPAEVAAAIRETAAALTPEGFVPRAHLWTDSASPRGTSFLSLFENRPAGVLARLLTLYVRAGELVRRHTAVVFTTAFKDGTEIATNNAKVLSISPASPARTVVSLPEVGDARKLYRVHLELVEHLGATARQSPLEGDPAAYQTAYAAQERARFIEAGYFYRDPHGDCYRATWKGAFLMTWKLLWPVSAIRRFVRRRQAEALLRACRAAAEHRK